MIYLNLDPIYFAFPDDDQIVMLGFEGTSVGRIIELGIY